MHPDGDRTLDELLAAAAPVTDRDLDRPEVRAAARALIEELPMPSHPTAPPTTTAGEDPALDFGDPDTSPDTTHGPLVGLPVRDERPRRSGRRAVGAAAAALALALGSAALMSGGGDGDGDPVVGGEPAGSLDAADGPTAADDPAPPADLSDTACGWTTQWLEAEALGDQEAQDQVVARMAEEAAAALAAREEQRAVEAEALMRTMSAGDVATLQAHQADSCTG